jgi:hypothetical protein
MFVPRVSVITKAAQRTFFATTLVFPAAARLAETPREVKAPARAEAEAML